MQVLARILYGSQNYGCSGPDSDKDYKLIMLPDFEDLYFEKEIKLPPNYDKEHYSVMDIRKWINLLRKGNFNAIEYLFSTNVEISGYVNVQAMDEFMMAAKKLFSEGYYLTKVWDQFFAACQGIMTQAFVRQGYTGKTVSRAYWIATFVDMVVANDFNVPDLFGVRFAPARDIRFGDHDPKFLEGWGDALLRGMQSTNRDAYKKLGNMQIKDYDVDFYMLNNRVQNMIKNRM